MYTKDSEFDATEGEKPDGFDKNTSKEINKLKAVILLFLAVFMVVTNLIWINDPLFYLLAVLGAAYSFILFIK